MMKIPIPRIVDVERATETHTAIDAQQIAPRQSEMQQGEEVLIPPHSDSVFRYPAEAFKNTFIERLVQIGPIADGLWRRFAGARQRVVQRFDLQSVYSDNTKALIHQIVRQRVSGR